MDRTKKILISMLVLGALAAVGAGTYATFNAQTQNAGNTFATGTILLSETQNAAAACFSYGGGAGAVVITNTNACAAAFNLSSNAVPGSAGMAGLIFQNTGTLNSTTFNAQTSAACASNHPAAILVYGNGSLCNTLVPALQEEQVGPLFNTALASGTSYSALSLAGGGIPAAIPANTPVLLVNAAGNSQAVLVTVAAAATATALTVQTFTANAAYAVTDRLYVPKTCYAGNIETAPTAAPAACTFDVTGGGVTVGAAPGGNTVTALNTAINMGALPIGAGAQRYFVFGVGLPTTADNTNQGLCLGTTTACAGLTINWTIQ